MEVHNGRVFNHSSWQRPFGQPFVSPGGVSLHHPSTTSATPAVLHEGPGAGTPPGATRGIRAGTTLSIRVEPEFLLFIVLWIPVAAAGIFIFGLILAILLARCWEEQ